MVLGLSEDIIGKQASSIFREVSSTYPYLSFIILASLSVAFAYILYPTRIPWALAFFPVLFIYWFVKKLRKARKPLRLDSKNLWKRLKSNLYQLFLSAFTICLLLIMFGTREEFVVPSFIIGSVALVSFLEAKQRLKKTE
jgi:hypothetical protein